eukprot:Opistho-2@29406
MKDTDLRADGQIASISQFLVTQALPHAYYIPNFITEDEEKMLLEQVYAAPKPKWTILKDRRLQNWGGLPNAKGMVAEDLPRWLSGLGGRLTELGVFPKQPNHVLVNEYLPNQGIMPHEDGPIFDPVIATVNLGSHTVIDFYRFMTDEERECEAPSHSEICEGEKTVGHNSDTVATSVHPSYARRYLFSFVLMPRSLLVLTDSMYKTCMHGIEGRLVDTPCSKWANAVAAGLYVNGGEGGVLPPTPMERSTRVSLTIRHVPKTVKVKLRLGK